VAAKKKNGKIIAEITPAAGIFSGHFSVFFF